MKRYLAIGAVLATAAVGCGGGDDDVSRDDVAKSIADASGISLEEAECVVDKIDGKLDLAAAADGELSDEDAATVTDATLDCIDFEAQLEK